MTPRVDGTVGMRPVGVYDRRRATPLPDARRPDPGGPPEDARGRAPWPPALRVAFRFACAYCVLYLAPFPLDLIPGVKRAAEWYVAARDAAVVWSGAHVLRLPHPIVVADTGSGDTTAGYVQNLLVLVVAAVAAAAWTAADRRRREYSAAHDWLRVYVRYGLAASLLAYGAVKVIKAQFPAPGLERLVEPYGQFSPMGVLWAFMGGSVAFNVLTGAGEMAGGALLLWRRTTTAGALLSIAVLANVVVLNFTYDVPVKLYSANLLLMAALLAAPDARRLFDVLVLNRAAPPADLGAFARGWCAAGRPRAARGAVKAVAVAAGVGVPLEEAWEANHTYGDRAPRPPLYGIYDVERFVVRGDTLAPLVTDTVRWRRMVFGRPGVVSVQMMSDSLRRFTLVVDSAGRTLRLASRPDSSVRYAFRYAPEGGALRLDGASGADSVHLRLRRVDHTRFQLLSRGFHWVQESPYNR